VRLFVDVVRVAGFGVKIFWAQLITFCSPSKEKIASVVVVVVAVSLNVNYTDLRPVAPVSSVHEHSPRAL